MAVTFFPSNPNVSAAVQAQFGANAAVDVAKLRAQEARALAQMQMQQQQQERFWRQQQMQQQDALAREQLKSEDFFRRGQLTNAAEQAKAKMAAATADNAFLATENEKNRVNQFNIAGLPQGQNNWRTQDLNAQVAQLSDAANNYATALNQKEALDVAELQIGKATKMEGKRTFWNAPANPSGMADYWLRGDSQRKSNVLSNLPKQIGNTPVSPDMALSPTENIGTVKAQLDSQKEALNRIIASGSAGGLDSHVSKGPDGKWVPTLKLPNPVVTPAPQATPFFNAPAPAMTNAPAAPVPPTTTNAPSSNVLPSTNFPALQRWTYVPGQGLVPR